MDKYNEDSIALHWYGGHPLAGEYINKIDHTNFLAFKNVLGKTIIKALK